MHKVVVVVAVAILLVLIVAGAAYGYWREVTLPTSLERQAIQLVHNLALTSDISSLPPGSPEQNEISPLNAPRILGYAHISSAMPRNPYTQRPTHEVAIDAQADYIGNVTCLHAVRNLNGKDKPTTIKVVYVPIRWGSGKTYYDSPLCRSLTDLEFVACGMTPAEVFRQLIQPRYAQ